MLPPSTCIMTIVGYIIVEFEIKCPSTRTNYWLFSAWVRRSIILLWVKKLAKCVLREHKPKISIKRYSPLLPGGTKFVTISEETSINSPSCLHLTGSGQTEGRPCHHFWFDPCETTRPPPRLPAVLVPSKIVLVKLHLSSWTSFPFFRNKQTGKKTVIHKQRQHLSVKWIL